MNISLKQTAEILNLTEDETMFENQKGTLKAMVDEDTMAWVFDLDEVLKLKEELDAAKAAEEDTEVEGSDE